MVGSECPKRCCSKWMRTMNSVANAGRPVLPADAPRLAAIIRAAQVAASGCLQNTVKEEPMSTPYPQAGASAEVSPTLAPAPTPMVVVPRTLGVCFTGSGSEYFRIWIVNVLLILVTLGLYFPWAKVRKLRYFYGNTVVDGAPLGFHGDGWKMFKGFAVMAAFFGLYSVAGRLSSAAGYLAFLVIAGLWPALFKASMQFRLANTSWRGLRFRFGGSTADAYKACLPLFIPGVVILGLVLALPELQSHDPAHPPSGPWLAVFGLVMLLALVITPWLMWNLKNYQHRHYHFSTETSQFTVKARRLYSLALKVVGIAVLAYVLLLVAAVVWGIGVAVMASATAAKGPVGAVLVSMATVLVGIVAFSAIQPYAIARFQNLVWNGTRSAHLQFHSALRARKMAALTLKNWLLMLLTLGLYWPFAAVAMARLRLAAMDITTQLEPADLLAHGHGREGQTLGEATGDFLGIDLGL